VSAGRLHGTSYGFATSRLPSESVNRPAPKAIPSIALWLPLAKLMREHDIGAIPIGENDKLIGMVTDRDIVCKGLALNGFDADIATARDVMTPGIHCCRDDDDLAKAVRHMEQLQVRRLPVINKSKRMVGILSLGDLSRSASGDLLSEWVKSVSAHH
jgi:predicted transcriptional regulator